MNAIKIILADDHRLFRDGVKAVLKRQKDFLLLGEAENGAQLLDLVVQHEPDVVLVDISMPQLNGLQAVEAMIKQDPSLKIIILTMHEEGDYVVKSIQSGAKGYLLKSVEPGELQNAIRIVAGGGRYFRESISDLLVANLANQEKEEPLTPRENEVLRYIVEGFSNHQIAYHLKISTRTVEKHRVNLMKKLQVANTAELVRKTMERKLLS